MAATANTAASPRRPDRGSGRSHAKYAAMKGSVKKLRLQRDRRRAVRVKRDPEEGRDLDRHGRRHGQAEGDPHLPGPAGRGRLGASVPFVAREDELLPEALRVLSGELPRQGVDGPHPLDGHQEGFVVGEPVGAERRDLLAKVIFQLRRVLARDGLALAEVGAPCLDLRLERVHRGVVRALLVHGRQLQIFPSVLSTVCHWRRSSASCSRPASVTR